MNKLNKIKVFKFAVSLFLIILLSFSVLSSFNFKSTSAQVIQTTVYCSNNRALCTSGLAASCANPDYTPTCFGDSNFQPIECCRSSGISLDCRPDITFICSPGSSTTTSSTSSTTSSTSTSSSTSSSGTSTPLCSTGTFCSNGYVPDCTIDEDFSCIGSSMNTPVCINKITIDKRTPNCIIPACTSSGSFCMQGLVPDCSFPERFKCIGGVGNIPCCFDGTADICRIPNCIAPSCISNGTFCQGGFIPDCNSSETFQCVDSMPYCIMNGSLVGSARTPNCISPSCTSGLYCSSGSMPDCISGETFQCINNTPCCLNNTTYQCRIPVCLGSSSSSSSSSSGGSSSSGSSSSSSSGGSSSSGSSSSSSSGGSSSSSSSGGSSSSGSSSSSGGSSSSSSSSSSSGGSSSSGSSSSSSSGGSSSSSSSGGSSSSSSSSSGGSSSGGSRIFKGSNFDEVSIEILSSPDLPNTNEQSLIPDGYLGVAGTAYSGSNPSFEIKLPKELSSTVISVDLKDSSGVIYKKVSFTLRKETGSNDTYILSLSIPNKVSKGELRFALNLSDGGSYAGIIYITSPVKAKVFNGNSRTTKPISAPIVSRVVSTVEGNLITLSLRGKDFVGKAYFFEDKNSTKFVVNPSDSANTTVTVFPTSLNLEVGEVSVSANGQFLKARLTTPEGFNEITNAVLVISTPSGTTSKSFTLRP